VNRGGFKAARINDNVVKPIRRALIAALLILVIFLIITSLIAVAQESISINKTVEVSNVTIYYLKKGIVMAYGSNGVLINGSIYIVTVYRSGNYLLIYGVTQSQQAINASPVPKPRSIHPNIVKETPVINSLYKSREPTQLNPQQPSPAPASPGFFSMAVLGLVTSLAASTITVSMIIISENKRKCIDHEMSRLVDWLGARRPSITPRELINEAPPWSIKEVSRVVDMYEAFMYGNEHIDCGEFKKAVAEAMMWKPVSMKQAEAQ